MPYFRGRTVFLAEDFDESFNTIKEHKSFGSLVVCRYDEATCVITSESAVLVLNRTKSLMLTQRLGIPTAPKKRVINTQEREPSICNNTLKMNGQ